MAMTTQSPREELPSLTALRGIAAIVVMIYHFATMAFGRDDLPEAIKRGYMAVDLFFLLSGFVLSHVYGRHFVITIDRRDLASFAWARLARIYPVHLLT